MRALVVLGVACLVSGCTDEESPSESTNDSTIVVFNRLAGNRLAGNRLAANRLAANRLAGNRLSNNRLELHREGAAELMSTPDGREVLSYIVSCAVPEGTVLVGESGGQTYEFPGEIGLASEWLRHRLDSKGEGWVSACLFARVNAHNVTLPISLRGPNHRLAASADEQAGWTLEEGAFYGNLFTPDDEPIDWNACRGKDQAAFEGGGLTDRDCAEPDPANPGKTYCGFNYAGDCGEFAVDDRPACEDYSENGTFYRRCHGPADADDDDDQGHGHGHGHHHGWGCGHGHGHGDVYRQVITTFTVP